MSDTHTDKLEETVAHLSRIVEDLSEIVARQEREIDLLKRRVGLLLEREASREADAGGTIPLADQRPPHW
jgi:SlyX protein